MLGEEMCSQASTVIQHIQQELALEKVEIIKHYQISTLRL